MKMKQIFVCLFFSISWAHAVNNFSNIKHNGKLAQSLWIKNKRKKKGGGGHRQGDGEREKDN